MIEQREARQYVADLLNVGRVTLHRALPRPSLSPVVVPRPAPARPAATRSNSGFRMAVTLGRSGRIWWTRTASLPATRASGASSTSFTPAYRWRLAWLDTAPGEEAQVDYGTGPMVREPLSGKYRRTRLFVMTLGYSRKSVRLLVFRSSS